MPQDELTRLATLETQIRIFKWVLGGFCTLAMAVAFVLSGWIYTQGSELASLKKEVSFQSQTINKHDSTIDSTSKKLSDMSGDIKATKIHIKHINEGLKDIKEILKKQRK
jgi:peptidoglycan hydrolase CwlO-like protein